MKFLILLRRKESLGARWSRCNQLALSGPELCISDAMFMQHFLHGLGTESVEYLDMTSGGSLCSLHG
jgi:hypothetical protein